MGLCRKKGRMGIAAAVGAGWVCLIAVFPMHPVLEALVTFLGVSSLMLWISFRPATLKKMFVLLSTLYLIAFLTGGSLNLLYLHTSAGMYIRQLILGEKKMEASDAGIIFGAVIGVCIVVRIVNAMEQQKKRQKNRYTAELYFGKQQVTVQGFIDTGNGLKEPITGKAVHILQQEAAALLMSEEEKPMSFLVPYHAVGTEEGLLTAIRIDQMELTSEDGAQVTLMRPLLGLYHGKLSSNGEYQLILHAETKTGQGEIV